MSPVGCRVASFQSAGPLQHDSSPPPQPGHTEGTVLAFDFGSKRIGVAVGDTALGIAHPLATIEAEDNRRRFERIAALVDEWHPVRLVIGCPAGSQDHALMSALRSFERRLAARFGLPVDRVDETLSSWDASRRLSRSGVAARGQKPLLDAMSACVILETWFEVSRAAVRRGRA